MNFNTEFLKTGPCCISYKGKLIGVTFDSPMLNIDPEFYEAKASKIGDKTISKVITNVKIIVSADIKEINSDFTNFFNVSGDITNIVFDRNVLLTGGHLCLSPVSGNKSISYCFPKAVLIPESVYVYRNNKEHYLKICFEVYEDFDGLLMEKHSEI